MIKIITKFDYKATVVVAAVAVLLSSIATTAAAQSFTYPSGSGGDSSSSISLKSLLNDLSGVTNVNNSSLGNTTAAPSGSLDEQIAKLQEQLIQLQSQSKQAASNASFTTTDLDSIYSGLRQSEKQAVGTGVSQPASVYAFRPDSQWCEVQWTRPLQIGDRGQDVYALQKMLNANGVTQIASSGEGAPGYETTYFGQKTAAAMARWQEQYRSDLLVPAGLSSGSGYFGEMTQGWVKRLCGDNSTPFALTDIKEVKKITIDPIPNAVDDEYTLYIIQLKSGKTHTVRIGFLPPGELETRFRAIGYTGDISKLMAMATSDAKSCVSGGSVFPEGTKKTTIVNPDGTSSTVSDGTYVCKSGKWKIEGSLPDEDDDSLFNYTVSGRTVTVTFELVNGCKGYTLSWGDGKVDRAAYSNSTTCTQEIREIELTHTFKKAGDYKIRLTIRGGGDSEYEKKVVKIK